MVVLRKVNQIKSTLIQWGFDENIACEGISCTLKNYACIKLISFLSFDRAAYKCVYIFVSHFEEKTVIPEVFCSF